MLVEFFEKLRKARIPVSVTEYLAMLEGLQRHVAGCSAEEFYYLSRVTLVKDEKYFDRFDTVFSAHFKGLDEWFDRLFSDIPEEWLAKQAELLLRDEEKTKIKTLGGWEALMKTLRDRLQEQTDRHQGGSKWIGTAGTSPYGAYGFNPEGVRIGQDRSRNRRAVKVWDRREYRNLDDNVSLGTRNLKLALRPLRRFARQGALEELDLSDTIRATARNGGLLDIKMIPERRNAVKVLLFLDVGGSMDMHVRSCEELFSAARSEFKHLEYFYFHNFLYDFVWKDNRRRREQQITLMEIINTYGRDHKVIVVGDASMSPYEITMPGGGIEFWNEEAGAVWASRLLAVYPYAVWLNPVPESSWPYTQSIQMIQALMKDRMFPLTLKGLEDGINTLKRGINPHFSPGGAKP